MTGEVRYDRLTIDKTDRLRLLRTGDASFEVQRYAPTVQRWFTVATKGNEAAARRLFGKLAEAFGEGEQVSRNTRDYA